MKAKLSNKQLNTIEACNNNYLKVLYITDFIFNKDRTRDGFCAALSESNKTGNINVKMFYLYLTCKFNLNRTLLILEDAMVNISLNYLEEKEVNNLNFIDMKSYRIEDDEEKQDDSMKSMKIKIKEFIKDMRRS